MNSPTHHSRPVRRAIRTEAIPVLVVLLILGTRSSVEASGQPERPASAGDSGRVKSVDVVVLSTMLADRAGVGEWGFAALVEADGRRILFDTGARPETVLRNAGELGVELGGVSKVILSHHHGDHTGGLVTLRRELSRQNPK